MAMITAEQARADIINAWTEKQLQEHIVGLARGLGWKAYHTYDSRRSEPGYPDLHLVHPIQRRSLFRELKSRRGVVSPDQIEWGQALAAAGQDFDVWRPADVINNRVLYVLQGIC